MSISTKQTPKGSQPQPKKGCQVSYKLGTKPEGGAKVYTLGGVLKTETDVAQVLAVKYNGLLRFDHRSGVWFELDEQSGIWNKCGKGQVEEYCRILADSEAAVTLRRNHAIRGAVAIAGRMPVFALDGSEWDADGWKCGTPHGVLDLTTGEFCPGTIQASRDSVALVHGKYLVSKSLVCAPASTPSNLWLRCMDEWTGADKAMQRMLQVFCGYALTGSITEHKFMFLHGAGSNGKSVFVETIQYVLGDYSRAVPMDIFMARQQDRHPAELAQLDGRRLVIAAETQSGRKWNDERIKMLTGGDRINARLMHQNPYEFAPTFKLLLHGNYRPRITDVGEAMRRRLRLVPFRFTPSNPDPDLGDKLRREAPGILRWMLDGCLEWQKSALPESRAVNDATRRYFAESDVIGQWLEDCCEERRDGKASIAELWASWERWCSANGGHELTKRALGAELTRRGFETGTARMMSGARPVRVRFGITATS